MTSAMITENCFFKGKKIFSPYSFYILVWGNKGQGRVVSGHLILNTFIFLNFNYPNDFILEERVLREINDHIKTFHFVNPLPPEGRFLAFLLCPCLFSNPLASPFNSHTVSTCAPYLVSTETEGKVMEVFQPFGSEAWPSGQRDGVWQSQEVVVESPARSADWEGAVVVAQRVDLRGKGAIRLAARAGPLRGLQWRPRLVQPKWGEGRGIKNCGVGGVH